MDVIRALDTWHYIFVYALIHLIIYICTCVKETKASLKFYTNFIPEVINIDFPQIWHFEVNGTGWVGMELSFILAQTVGRFNM